MIYRHDYDKTGRRAQLLTVRCGTGARSRTSARPPCCTSSGS